MLSEYLINKIAEETKDKIRTAEIDIDGRTEEVAILKKEIKGNLLKVFVSSSNDKGNITDIRLLDREGHVLISKPKEMVKTVGYAIVSSFYIRFVEEELEDPVNIFELRKESSSEIQE